MTHDDFAAFTEALGDRVMRPPEDRSVGLGGSDAPVACGVSPYRTRTHLWWEKTKQAGFEPQPVNVAMRHGTAVEQFVLQLAEERIGGRIGLRQACLRMSAGGPLRWATVDGMTFVDDEPVLVQAKTARSDAKWGDDGTDQIPVDYRVQVHHEMLCAGVKRVIIPVLFAGVEFRMFDVRIDDELANEVLAAEDEFWELVVAKTPPVPVTLEEVNQRFAKATRPATILSPEATERFMRFRELKAELKAKQEQLETIEAMVRRDIGEAELAYAADGETPLATWKNQTARRVDVKRLQAEAPDIYNRFCVESESRVLRLK